MRVNHKLSALLATGIFLAAPLASYAKNQPGTVEEQVARALNSLPYYNVFDSLSFRVDNGVVTLFGQVIEPPFIKDDAGSAVKGIEGVRQVKNEIEVLPVSPMDNQMRRATYRSIYGYPALQRYAEGVVPTIHIIVKNGHVTLEGAVSTEEDKQLAYTRAMIVPNVFSVTNNLEVHG